VRPKLTLSVFLKWLYYALVPILTLGVEDSYLVEVIGYKPAFGQFPLSRSGITVSDIAGCVLLGLAIPFCFDRRSRSDLKLFALLAAAVLISGYYGLTQGASPDYTLFEPSVWKTLVPLLAFTISFNRIFRDARERDRFLSWFCTVQFAFALFALSVFLVSGWGQPTYFEATVPVFAGDMLFFLVIAYAISLFRLVNRPSWRDGLYVAVLCIVVMLSLRRTFILALLSAPLFFAAVAVASGRGARRWLRRVGLVALVMLMVGILFFGVIAPMRLTPAVVLGRMRSLDLIWALKQEGTIFGSMGHTDDFLDGLEVMMSSPILGKGLAVWFPLSRTWAWQDANVHAGILKIWIKLGLLGVIAYLLLFGRGLRLLKDIRVRDGFTGERLFAVWFSIHFIATSLYMNSKLFGYKNSFVVAIYLALCTALLAERRNASAVSGLRRPR